MKIKLFNNFFRVKKQRRQTPTRQKHFPSFFKQLISYVLSKKLPLNLTVDVRKLDLSRFWTPQNSPVFRHPEISENQTKLDSFVLFFFENGRFSFF